MDIIKNFLDNFKYEKFRYIVPLGYNCETAFRFWQNYKFLDSSLFAWTISSSIEDLINSLIKFDSILSGEIALPNPLYECQNTHIRFHGKANMKNWINCQNYDIALVNEDKEELRQRTAYLKDKFIKILNSTDTKLFIYKICISDLESPDLNANIEKLYSFFENKTQNFKLVIVTEENFRNKIQIKRDNLIIETVEKYSPEEDVTNKKKGDSKGWRKIYKKYRPAVLLKTKKKFKFEEI